jgi:hypothetical protein
MDKLLGKSIICDGGDTFRTGVIEEVLMDKYVLIRYERRSHVGEPGILQELVRIKDLAREMTSDDCHRWQIFDSPQALSKWLSYYEMPPIDDDKKVVPIH